MRYNERIQRIVDKSVERFGVLCVFIDKTGNEILFNGIKRSPSESPVGETNTIVYPFIITKRTLDIILNQLNYTDKLFSGEKIRVGDELYQINRGVPYIVDDGSDGSVRIITTKIAQ